MPKISALKQQVKNRSRVSVFLDGQFGFGLQSAVAAELTVGQELSQAEIEALHQREALEVAYERSLFYLSFRPRSEAEIARYLAKKQIDDDIIQQVLVRLRRAKLVDDAAFAELWVENRENLKPRGRWGLRSELRQKGIAKDIIEEAVQNVDEETGAWQVAQRAVRRLERLDERTFRRRLVGSLQRRGFGYDVSFRVTNRLWQMIESRDEPDPD